MATSAGVMHWSSQKTIILSSGLVECVSESLGTILVASSQLSTGSVGSHTFVYIIVLVDL